MSKKSQVYVFIVRPPILAAPPNERVVLATGANMDDAFENVRGSLHDKDFNARCVGAYTRDQLTKLIADKASMHHHQAWAALDYVADEYDLPARDVNALRRVQDRVLSLMLTMDRPSKALQAK